MRSSPKDRREQRRQTATDIKSAVPVNPCPATCIPKRPRDDSTVPPPVGARASLALDSNTGWGDQTEALCREGTSKPSSPKARHTKLLLAGPKTSTFGKKHSLNYTRF